MKMLAGSRSSPSSPFGVAVAAHLQLPLLRSGAWPTENNPFGLDRRTDGRRVADWCSDRRLADPLSGCQPDYRHRRGRLLLRQHTRAGSVA